MRTVLRRRKAVSSIVATLMLMLITVTTLSITLVFVQSNLTRGEAENNFVFAKVFMKTVGLQVDDVAWQTGQMDTIQYSSRDGEMFIREGILEYEVKVKYIGITGETIVADYTLNGLFFSIPISKYSLDNSYFSELLPGDMSTLILSRSTDPVARVFVVQKNPIGPEGDYESEYIRIGVVPVQLKKALISQKDPRKIVSGKLALKKCWMVRTEAAIMPAPAKKLQNRCRPAPSTVNDSATADLLLLLSGYYTIAAPKDGSGLGRLFSRQRQDAGHLADDVDELRVRGDDDLGVVHQCLFDSL